MLATLTAPAIVVVDIQRGTLPSAIAIGADALVATATGLIGGFRAAGRPVVFLTSTGTPPGLTHYGPGGRTWPDGFAELDVRLGRRDDEPVLSRAAWSAFAGTDLDERLGLAGVREVIVVGLATTFGVESTARAAADLGYDVVVVSDAVSDPDPVGHERTLTRVIPALGRVAVADEVVAAL